MKLQFVVACLCRKGLCQTGASGIRVLGVAFLVLLHGCFAPPSVDLTGPHVVQASPCVGEKVVSVMPEASVDFSEAMDPFSVHQGSFAVLPWLAGGRCDRAGNCPQGVCTQGQCFIDPVDEVTLRALAAGAYEGGAGLQAWWAEGPAGPGSRLMFQPHAPLLPHTRYSLVAGAAMSDQSGASLVSGTTEASEEQGAWSCEFETSDRGSSGPQAELIWPPPGTVDVPTNLAEVRVVFAGEVTWGEAKPVLELEASNGLAVELVAPELCPGGSPPGETCVVFHLDKPL
ncbi:MAG: hypothetical protein ACPG4T_08570, partial [Nannocystaceae bacterium]